MNEWIKHNQLATPPVDSNVTVQIETFASLKRDTFLASEIDWRLVKFYREVE